MESTPKEVLVEWTLLVVSWELRVALTSVCEPHGKYCNKVFVLYSRL